MPCARRRNEKRRRFTRTIRVRAEAGRSINSAADESRSVSKKPVKSGLQAEPVRVCVTWAFLLESNMYFLRMKEVIKVVLLDELKLNLSAYEEPLKDLRDSL